MSPPQDRRTRYRRFVVGGVRGRRDRTAFERFCAEEYGRLVAYVAFIVGDREVAADAANEALARAWRRMRRGEEIESMAGWVRVVALNVARDQFRKRKREAAQLCALEPPVPNLEYTKW